MKQMILKNNTLFLLISLICLFILTLLILSVKEENRLTLVGGEVVFIDKFSPYIEMGVTYRGEECY